MSAQLGQYITSAKSLIYTPGRASLRSIQIWLDSSQQLCWEPKTWTEPNETLNKNTMLRFTLMRVSHVFECKYIIIIVRKTFLPRASTYETILIVLAGYRYSLMSDLNGNIVI